REDPESSEQLLHAADQLLADHVQADVRRLSTDTHVALGLEQAPEVGPDDRKRRREQLLRDLHVDAARNQPPLLDERAKHIAVKPCPPAVEGLVLRDDAT